MEASTVRGFARSYQTGLTELRLAQKSPRGTAAYSRHVNRPAARRVAAVLNVASFTPNMATAVSALLSAAGLVLVAVMRPTPSVGVMVALLLAAGYVMDSVDGQLARLRGGGSLSGEMLDHAVDCVKTVGIHLAVLISWFRFPPIGGPAWLLVPIGFQIVDVLSFFGLVTMPLLRRLHDNSDLMAQSSSGLRPEHPLRRWALLPTDYGIFCWMFVLLGWPLLFVIAYGAMFIVNVVVMFPVLAKWSRELRRMDLTA
jgi:phosphatidylglycerophosphate synthase